MEGADVRCGTLRGYMMCGRLSAACASHEERADSVERVAREAVCSLVAIGEVQFARGNMPTAQCALDWAKECIDRLKALGVEM